ncbi:hypothetical protein MKW98_031143 [Papaver atlanticum]|uniref:DUF1985 domain-containing protein n=1 Tax=Papaver atlanticum TaxID=357466 RepID=A0AAD4XJU8_9MAGN|nr:hypothetical protein MKW98_031143 [Papaver atlanticum]
MKHFPDDEKPVIGSHLKELLFGKEDEAEKKSSECHQSSDSNAERESHDRVKVQLESDENMKLSLLYVIHRYVLGKADDKVVEDDHWYLVYNLVDFSSYPWAEIAFIITIDKVMLP